MSLMNHAETRHRERAPNSPPIPWRLNLGLFFLFLLAQSFTLFLFPWAHAQLGRPAIGVLTLTVLITIPSWYLSHEAVHYLFHPNPRVNNWAGRILCIWCGVPFAGIRYGHLLHHRWNRIDDFTECYDKEKTSWISACFHHFGVLLGGFYWGVVLGSVLLWLPKPLRQRVATAASHDRPFLQRFFKVIMRPDVARENRFDAMVSILLYIIAFRIYGPLWGYFLAALLGRAFLVSVFDNSFHYESPRNPLGHPEISRNHAMIFPTLILNFNYHQVHHLYPSLPWIYLAAKAREVGATCTGGYLYWAIRQFRGPIAMQDLDALMASRDLSGYTEVPLKVRELEASL